MKRVDVIRPTLRPCPSNPWGDLEMFTSNGRYYMRSKPADLTDFCKAARFLSRLSQPGRLEAVTEFLNQLDELER